MFSELVDIKEEKLLKFDIELLSILLMDNSTNKNIIWATDNYVEHGYGFGIKDYIKAEKVTGIYKEIIRPRVKKTKEEQTKRIRDKAEVFTPSWLCNKQNNEVDRAWFEGKSVFNKELGKSWKTYSRKIKFPDGKSWKDYIELLRLEISCGEAPYLVSRYDTVSGEIIELKNRIGLLDRKFRIINENVSEETEWIDWAKKAIKSVYGYDWQGDNVLLARENILYTFSDNYQFKFQKKITPELAKDIAYIISWNIWQMDGINFIVPYSCHNEKYAELTLFGEELKKECLGCLKGNIHKHNGVYSKIMNWKSGRKNTFIYLINRSEENGKAK